MTFKEYLELKERSKTVCDPKDLSNLFDFTDSLIKQMRLIRIISQSLTKLNDHLTVENERLAEELKHFDYLRQG